VKRYVDIIARGPRSGHPQWQRPAAEWRSNNSARLNISLKPLEEPKGQRRPDYRQAATQNWRAFRVRLYISQPSRPAAWAGSKQRPVSIFLRQTACRPDGIRSAHARRVKNHPIITDREQAISRTMGCKPTSSTTARPRNAWEFRRNWSTTRLRRLWTGPVSTMYTSLNQYHVVMEAAPQYWQNPDISKRDLP